MKEFTKTFGLRGLIAAGFGPIILGIIYGILGKTGAVDALSPSEASIGILSITLMAFIAGGITSVYVTERLPLPSAILIHAAVLYLDYLIMYLLNDWIPKNAQAIGIFTAIFFVCFALIWLGIWLSTRKKTNDINKNLGNAR